MLEDGQEVMLCGGVSYHVGQEVVDFIHISALEVKEKHYQTMRHTSDSH